MNIPTLIVEDNPQAARELSQMLSAQAQITPLEIVSSLAEAREAISRMRPVLLFIDIELPDGNGIDFWDELRCSAGSFMHAIFYTAFDHYAIRALRSGGHDYLLKPVSQDDVTAALSRFYASCTGRFLASQNSLGGGIPENEQSMDIMVLDSLGHRIAIKPSDICYFSYVSNRKIWEVFCMDGKNYTLRHGINAPRLLQISPKFVQTHKSYIVNTSYITRIENTRIVLCHPYENAEDVQVTKLYRNDLLEHFYQL